MVRPPPQGFPPLRRPCSPPPPPPLRGTSGPLRRPCGPRCFPALPRLRLPHFPASLHFFLLAPASPHGGPAFLPHRRLRKGLSWCHSCQTALPPVILPRRFLACPMATPSACICSPSGSPVVILSSSVSPAKSPSLPPLHPSLAVLLSPWLYLSHPPLSPSLPTCDFWTRRPRSISAIVLPRAVILRPVSASPRDCSKPSPLRPPSPVLLPPSSRRPLRPLAPPLALLPPAPADDISHRDKDVSNQTSRVGVLRSVAGVSAPRRKIPSRPPVVVGDGIRSPLLLYLPQQYYPVHFRPALRHLYAQADGTVVE